MSNEKISFLTRNEFEFNEAVRKAKQDGYRFSGTSESTYSDHYCSIFLDENHYIWVGTVGDLNTFSKEFKVVEISDYLKTFYVKSVIELTRMTVMKNLISDDHSLLEYVDSLKRIFIDHSAKEKKLALKWLLGDDSIKVSVKLPTKFALETIAANNADITFYYCETNLGIPTKTNSIKGAMLFGTRQGAEKYQTPAWKIIEVNDYE